MLSARSRVAVAPPVQAERSDAVSDGNRKRQSHGTARVSTNWVPLLPVEMRRLSLRYVVSR